MKKIVSLFTAFCMAFSIIITPATIYGNESTTIVYTDPITNGTIYFDYAEKAIVSADSSITSITIPKTINNVEVQYISNHAFYECDNLTSIVLPDTLISIGEFAFGMCDKLESVDIPNSVYILDDYAFYQCPALTNVKLPDNDNFDIINSYTFYQCASLKEIIIPNSVVQIGTRAFEDCSSLKSISYSNGLFNIEPAAFAGCTSLSSVILPQKIQTIESGVFYGCSSLSKVQLPAQLLNINNNAFSECKSLKEIVIPNTVKSIGEQAFRYCTDLASVTLPPLLKTISDGCFMGCESLCNINIPNQVKRIEYGAFSGCSNLAEVTLPTGLTTIEDSAFKSSGIEFINLPSSLISIGEKCFESCKSLDSIRLPNSISKIPPMAFAYCYSLGIYIPESVTEIAQDAFYGGVRYIHAKEGSYAYTYARNYDIDYTVEEDNSVEFTLEYHNNRFIHSNKDKMNAGFTGLTNYAINKKYLQNLSKDEKKKMQDLIDEEWQGSCMGITTTVALSYLNILTLPTNYFNMPYPHQNPDFLSIINYYQQIQSLERFYNSNIIVTKSMKHWLYGQKGVEYYECMESLINELDKNDCVLFSYAYLDGTDRVGHVCIALNYKVDNKGNYIVKVYDVNKPYTFLTLEISSDFKKFSYTDGNGNLINHLTCRGLTIYDIKKLAANGFNEQMQTSITPSKSAVNLENTETEASTSSMITVPINASFEVEFDNGKTIIFNQESVSGTMDVIDVYPVYSDENPFYIIEVEPFSSLTMKNIETNISIKIDNKDKYYSVSGENLDTIEFTDETGITLSGTNYSFDTRVSANNEDSDLLSIRGKSSGDIVVQPTYDTVIIQNEQPITNLDCKGYKDEYVVDLEVEKTENSIVLPETVPTDVRALTIGEIPAQQYTGKAITPKFEIQYEYVPLVEGEDYTLSYSQNVNLGTATIIITGMGKYAGSREVTFDIMCDHQWGKGTVITNSTCTKDGEKEYTCQICNSKKAENIQAPGHTKVTDKAIAPTCTKAGKTAGSHCSKCNTIIKEQKTVAATGHTKVTDKAIAPTCTKAGKTTGSHCSKCDTVIQKQKTVSATGHKEKTVVKKATTKESGKITKKCGNCNKVFSAKTINRIKTIKLSYTSTTYNNKVKSPKVIIKDSKGKIISSKYYTVTKSKGRKKVGKYTYKVKFIEKYSGSKTMYLTIKPLSTSVKSLKASKKSFTVKWKKVSKEASGYQIMYATNKSFSKGKKVINIKKNSITTKKIQNLKAKKVYYVKIRTYKIVNDKKFYSTWSKVKKVKTMK